MLVTPAALGPVVELHDVAPADPEIVHVTAPLGGEAFAGPVTLAVNVTAPPNVRVPLEVKAIDGVAVLTTVEVVEVVVAMEL